MIEDNPNGTIEISLDRHKDLPDEKRPVFVLRVLNRREARQLGRKLEALAALNKKTPLHEAERVMDQLEDAVKASLVDWRNLPRPFKADDLDLVITDADVGAMAAKLRYGAMISAADLGNSESPSPSSMTICAPTAAAANA